jgi:MoxR-like ATPase
MQEGQVTIEGTPHPLAPPFMVLATQNPIEQEGTYALPEAQLDRFLLKIHIEFSTQEDEHAMVRQVTTNQVGDRLNVESVSTLVKPAAVLALQRFVASLTVDGRVSDYAVRIARATAQAPAAASLWSVPPGRMHLSMDATLSPPTTSRLSPSLRCVTASRSPPNSRSKDSRPTQYSKRC